MRKKSIQWLMVIAAVSCLAWVGGLAWTLQDYFITVAGPMEKATAPAAADRPASAQPAPAVPSGQAVPAGQPASEQAAQPASGLVDQAAQPASGQPAQSAESASIVKDGAFRVLALGDSITRGTGDPQGKGYVGYLTDDLKDKSGREIEVENYGVNGQTSAQLATSLQQSQIQAQVKAADIIVFSIGGNDLFQSGQTMNLNAAKVKEIEDAYMRQLDAILMQLRQENNTARIFLIGLYNPFIELSDAVTTNKIVRDWNYKALEITAKYPQTVLVPTFDLFQLKVQDLLARDLFHPNSAGHRLIGDRVAALITW
jgi:lysophospholipase L1-like esterase